MTCGLSKAGCLSNVATSKPNATSGIRNWSEFFGRLLRESRVTEEQFAGLAEDKLSYIEQVASL